MHSYNHTIINYEYFCDIWLNHNIWLWLKHFSIRNQCDEERLHALKLNIIFDENMETFRPNFGKRKSKFVQIEEWKEVLLILKYKMHGHDIQKN